MPSGAFSATVESSFDFRVCPLADRDLSLEDLQVLSGWAAAELSPGFRSERRALVQPGRRVGHAGSAQDISMRPPSQRSRYRPHGRTRSIAPPLRGPKDLAALRANRFRTTRPLRPALKHDRVNTPLG